MSSTFLTSISNASKLALGLAGCAVAAVVAFAASTIDEEGFGSVGKGDVQDAFGWNNSQLQSNAGLVSFSFEAEVAYVAVCEWTTGPSHNRKTHVVTKNLKTGIISEVKSDTRKNNQGSVTGFVLNGFTDIEDDGVEVPVVGGDCLGEGTNGKWIEVSPVGEASVGGLYVSFSGQKILLPTTY
jgi:hypothetical protein